MHFGLTNAPSNFQVLINVIFKPLLLLLREFLTLLRQHQFYAKMSKYRFRACKVEYLGHVISKGTLAMDTSKVDCVANWPVL